MNLIYSVFAVASLTLVVLLSATMASIYAQNETQSSTNQTSMTNSTGMNTTAMESGDTSEEDLEEESGQISTRRRGGG